MNRPIDQHDQHDAEMHRRANLDRNGPFRALTPQLLLAGFFLLVALTAVTFLWSPWDSSDNNTVPVRERIAQETPVAASTPNP